MKCWPNISVIVEAKPGKTNLSTKLLESPDFRGKQKRIGVKLRYLLTRLGAPARDIDRL